MLVAIGFGLGAYVSEIDGRSYAQFVAPGIVASYAMWHSVFDSTYGAYIRMETNHLYEAYLFTPLEPADIVMGEVMWAATRATISATAVLIATALFGLVESPLAVLAIPVAYMIGMMFGSMAMVMTATATTIGAMNNFFTLFLLPMFWVGGVFFPLERLPDALRIVAWVLPLAPSAALTRGLVTGDVSPMMLAWAGQILLMFAAAFLLASWLMKRRLIR
jgi:lipooligosaccharide transport system permease protein